MNTAILGILILVMALVFIVGGALLLKLYYRLKEKRNKEEDI